MRFYLLTIIVLLISNLSVSQTVRITELGSDVNIAGTQLQFNGEVWSSSVEIVIHNVSGLTKNLDLIRVRDSQDPRWREDYFVVTAMQASSPDGWEIFGGTGLPTSTSNPFDLGYGLILYDGDSVRVQMNYQEIDSVANPCSIYTYYIQDVGVFVDSVSFQICGEPLAVNEILLEEQIRIFPNPANDELHFSGLNSVGAEVKLISMSGTFILTTTLTTASSSISLGVVSDGIYSVELSNSNGLISRRKIIVQK
jgi:hypothetical protein